MQEKTNQDGRRTRIWALTINEEAECFKNLETQLISICGKKDKWAYILHDKDYNEETGEVKKSHYHALLEFENARGFNSIRKTFEGAHIEKALGASAYGNYLLHNGKPDKYHYSQEEVKTNDKVWYKGLLIVNSYETYDEDRLPYYILIEGVNNYLKACLRFGAKQLPYGVALKIGEIIKGFNSLLPEDQESTLNQIKRLYQSIPADLPF